MLGGCQTGSVDIKKTRPSVEAPTEAGCCWLALATGPLATDHNTGVWRRIVVLTGLPDRPLRAVRIDAMAAVRPTDDCRLRIDRDDRQGAERERRRDQILGERFHSLSPSVHHRRAAAGRLSKDAIQ